jgi:hypothetical protein
MTRFRRATRAAAIGLFMGIAVWGITTYRRPSPPVSPPPRPAPFSVDVPWRRSNWDNACVIRAARHRSSYDPGITPGYRFTPLPDCRECDGYGGHKGRTPDDPEDGDDMKTCDSCDGTGVISPH